MGFFKPTAFAMGLAKGGLDLFDKAEKASEEGLENLKAAKDEVNEEIASMKNNYNKAIQVGDNVGGGGFAKYLFDSQDINYLANLSESTQESKLGELSTLKKIYENLPEERKAEYEQGVFGDVVKEKYDSEVDSLKIKKGLVSTNNMGEATANTLAGKVQTMVDRSFVPRRDAIIDTVSGGGLKESKPIEGGFEALPTATTGVVDFQTGGQGNLELARLKVSILNQFEDFLESNRFKVRGTNIFTNDQALRAFGNIVGIEYERQYTDGEMGRDKIKNLLNEGVENLEGIGIPTTQGAIMEDVFKQNYINNNYGDVFNYSGLLDVLDNMVDESE